MMANGGEFPYYKDNTLGCEIMGFPYKGNKTTMFVILPTDSSVQKLRAFENKLTTADILRLVNSAVYTEAVMLFPKMKLESTVNLQPTLFQLGVRSLFNPSTANLALISSGESPTEAANMVAHRHNVNLPQALDDSHDLLIFSRMGEVDNSTNSSLPKVRHTRKTLTPQVQLRRSIDALESIRRSLSATTNIANPGLYADQVIHKVYMDITESGTEAAAATGISLNRAGGRVTFRADMPFLFFIMHHETKTVLFWGSVKTPTPNVPPQ